MLPLAHVVVLPPPIDPVADAEPTVLIFVVYTGLPAASKYPGICPGGGCIWCKEEDPGARAVATRSRPARREMRSARSASRFVLVYCECAGCVEDGRAVPRWPSLMAVVERTESEVVVLLGVPLYDNGQLAINAWSVVLQNIRHLRRSIWRRRRLRHIDENWSRHGRV